MGEEGGKKGERGGKKSRANQQFQANFAGVALSCLPQKERGRGALGSSSRYHSGRKRKKEGKKRRE